MSKAKGPGPSITLREWHAVRSGGRITVYGENIETGTQDKITSVDRIDPPSNIALHEVTATDKHQVVHRLIFG